MMRSSLVFVLVSVAIGGCSLAFDADRYRYQGDAGRDAQAQSRDGGERDAGGLDAGMADAGAVDSGPPDAGPPGDTRDPVRRIACGWTHTCVLLDGSVYCWGANDSGQLGSGDMVDSDVPVRVEGLPPDVVEISATGYFSCALTAGGATYCWGLNDLGQLGDGTRTMRLAPVRAAPAIGDAIRLSAGGESTCLVRESGPVLCWGRGSGGALGNGGFYDSPTPVQVVGLAHPLGIEGSGGHYCVRRSEETPACWGWNGNGQLGQPIEPSNELIATPVEPPGLAGVLQISAGGRHTCARTGSVVACWGWNMFGQLGNGSGPDSHTPVVVGGLDAAASDLSAGGSHTCALLETGDVYCWGANDVGQLGVGDRTGRDSPARVSGFTAPVEQLATGDYHSCALLSTGSVACWGRNTEGQLGTGTREDSLTPQIVDVGGA